MKVTTLLANLNPRAVMKATSKRKIEGIHGGGGDYFIVGLKIVLLRKALLIQMCERPSPMKLSAQLNGFCVASPFKIRSQTMLAMGAS